LFGLGGEWLVLLTWKREENGGYLMSDYLYAWLIVVRGGMVVLY
jgi:hypothetical protein